LASRRPTQKLFVLLALSLLLKGSYFDLCRPLHSSLFCFSSANNEFEVLGLETTYTEDLHIIKKAYRKISLVVHPDKNKHPQVMHTYTYLSLYTYVYMYIYIYIYIERDGSIDRYTDRSIDR